jgi:hypothetical protein
MARFKVNRHARDRMHQRGVSVDDILLVWLNPHEDRPSADHPGARLRTGWLPNGDEVTIVAIQTPDAFNVITVW